MKRWTALLLGLLVLLSALSAQAESEYKTVEIPELGVAIQVPTGWTTLTRRDDLSIDPEVNPQGRLSSNDVLRSWAQLGQYCHSWEGTHHLFLLQLRLPSNQSIQFNQCTDAQLTTFCETLLQAQEGQRECSSTIIRQDEQTYCRLQLIADGASMVEYLMADGQEILIVAVGNYAGNFSQQQAEVAQHAAFTLAPLDVAPAHPTSTPQPASTPLPTTAPSPDPLANGMVCSVGKSQMWLRLPQGWTQMQAATPQGDPAFSRSGLTYDRFQQLRQDVGVELYAVGDGLTVVLARRRGWSAAIQSDVANSSQLLNTVRQGKLSRLLQPLLPVDTWGDNAYDTYLSDTVAFVRLRSQPSGMGLCGYITFDRDDLVVLAVYADQPLTDEQQALCDRIAYSLHLPPSNGLSFRQQQIALFFAIGLVVLGLVLAGGIYHCRRRPQSLPIDKFQ
jgi:hypothetical protein